MKNQPRDQVATVIPLKGDASKPGTNVLEVVGHVLHNAFIRAYLPRLQGVAEDIEGLEFGPASVTDPVTAGAAP